ncbi:DNA-binding transcriptional LysR family regulator [Streptomyces griseochromogenes]|uniref:DNA-binding transcriptional LysR family regulator n=1 Tax=Streptomyces griseochromogenes TaxID=68214 RepID=A0A1B1AYT9_9ACTN|nr:LysR substrate-binding domain-containing protein [Streptomyces griseochromogenes]ANP51729.1 hypothetical protein AVL59_20955 [Streptomyces griseochromogenes]MBP2056428.1 DNA-binding transcriptional LysR family regulator [Streptomyces griseochromogenes]
MALAWAHRMLAEQDALRQELSAPRGGLTGTLRLGGVPTAVPVMSPLTTPFCDRHPRAGVTLEALSSAEIRHGLAEFELDAAMTYLDDDALRHVPHAIGEGGAQHRPPRTVAAPPAWPP